MNFKKLKGKHLFISKELTPQDPLYTWCADQSHVLTAVPQIDFLSTEFEWNGACDLVFFSSIRAAQFFLRGVTNMNENWQFACIGQVTATKLKDLGIQCAFIGDEAGNPKKVAEDFKLWAGDKTVCFPRSNRSLKSIQQQLPSNQIVDLEVYQTIHAPCFIAPHNIYVFTSPSNVEAFLEINEIPKNAYVIAWGKSTANQLLQHHLTPHATLKWSSQQELIDLMEAF